MLNRRGLIRLLVGGGVATRTASREDVVKAVGKFGSDKGLLKVDQDQDIKPEKHAAYYDRDWKSVEKLMSIIQDAERAETTKISEMPVYIRTKKSWSPAFKAYCFNKQLERDRIVSDSIYDKNKAVEKVINLLGLKR